ASDTPQHVSASFDFCLAFPVFILGAISWSFITSIKSGDLKEKLQSQIELNTKLKSDSTALRARMAAISPVDVGDELIVPLPLDGKMRDIEVCVSKAGTVEIPGLGSINILDIPGHQVNNYLTVLLSELAAL